MDVVHVTWECITTIILYIHGVINTITNEYIKQIF